MHALLLIAVYRRLANKGEASADLSVEPDCPTVSISTGTARPTDIHMTGYRWLEDQCQPVSCLITAPEACAALAGQGAPSDCTSHRCTAKPESARPKHSFSVGCWFAWGLCSLPHLEQTV